MSKKQFIALAVMAGLLLIVILVQKLSARRPDLEREMGLVALAPEGFLASDAARIEVYRGSTKDEKVALSREKEGWLVRSRFDAPAKKDKVDEFLKKLKGLEGEYRSDEAEVVADYGLTDEAALHIAVYKTDQKEDEKDPWYHILVGKKEKHGSSFVRASGKDTVYTVDVDLASELGLWGDEEKAPESSEWVDKTVIDLDKDKIERVALTTPDRSVSFERREKKKEGEGAEDKGGEDKDRKKEYEWVVASGGPGTEFKQSGLDDILDKLDSYEASGVEDPEKKKEFGLDEPGYRCEVGIEVGRKKVLVAAREKPGSDGYMIVEGGPIVYRVDSWKFKQVFKDAGDLFELKGPGADKDKVKSVTLAYPEVTVELVKEKEEDGDDKKWKMAKPDTGLKLKDWKPKDVARDLAGWKPDDYAAGGDAASYGLKDPKRRATFVMEDGKKHTIAFGAEAKGVEGWYALLDEGRQVWVSGKYDTESIFPKLKDFFELDVADVDRDDITKVTVERGEDAFALELKGDQDDESDKKWVLTVAGKTVPHDRDKVEDYLDRFSPVEASDIALGAKAGSLVAKAKVTVRVEAKEGKGLTIRFGDEKEGDVAALVEGGNVAKGGKAVLLFSKSTLEDLAPPSKDLAKPEPEKKPEKEAKDEPKEEPKEGDAAAKPEPTPEPEKDKGGKKAE